MSDENDSDMSVEYYGLSIVSAMVFVMTTSFELYGGDTLLKAVEFGIGSAALAFLAAVFLIALSKL
jgi:hypothetical protein